MFFLDGTPIDLRSLSLMGQIVSLPKTHDDTLWAVVASAGRRQRVAEIFANRTAALADMSWRQQQVSAYAAFLARLGQPEPRYSVTPIRRADLPRAWKPLPALGFLRGQFA